MRGKITDQDLTDYALNELQPEERFYVESMLAVSEECRNDVYEMIEMSQMLEEGFEMQEDKIVPISLKPEQRDQLMALRVPGRWVAKTAAVLAAAACVAFAVANPTLWQLNDPARQMARNVSTQVSDYVTKAVTQTTQVATIPVEGDAAVTGVGTFQKLAEDPALKRWFSSDWLSADFAPDFTKPQGPWTAPAVIYEPSQVQLDMPMPMP